MKVIYKTFRIFIYFFGVNLISLYVYMTGVIDQIYEQGPDKSDGAGKGSTGEPDNNKSADNGKSVGGSRRRKSRKGRKSRKSRKSRKGRKSRRR